MEISSPRIKLLPFNKSDWELFKALSMCPKIMEHVYDPFTLDEAKEAFESRLKPWSRDSESRLTLSINDISTGEKLGNIGLKTTHHDTKIAEVGFMIKDTAQGKGYACEALGLLIDYAFQSLNLNKLTATCSTKNKGSYHLLDKIGFVREGCLLQNSLINNQYVDDYIYGLCKSSTE